MSWLLGAEYLSTGTYPACHEYWEMCTYLQVLIQVVMSTGRWGLVYRYLSFTLTIQETWRSTTVHVTSTGNTVLIYRYLSIIYILHVMSTGSWVLIYRYSYCMSWVLGAVYLSTGIYAACHKYWKLCTYLQVLILLVVSTGRWVLVYRYLILHSVSVRPGVLKHCMSWVLGAEYLSIGT